MLHEFEIADFIGIRQLFADVDVVSSVFLLFFGLPGFVEQDDLSILKAQERLLKVKSSPFGLPVGNCKVGAACAKYSLRLL